MSCSQVKRSGRGFEVTIVRIDQRSRTVELKIPVTATTGQRTKEVE